LYLFSVRDCIRLTNQSFEILGKQTTNLDLTGIDQITDSTLFKIENCNNMTVLKLSSKNVSNEGIFQVARGCTNLITINLNGCELLTDESIKSLSKFCTQIQNLSISCCKNIKNEAFIWKDLSFQIYEA